MKLAAGAPIAGSPSQGSTVTDHRSDRCVQRTARRARSFGAIYLLEGGAASTSFGLSDLGITNLNDVCEDVRRMMGAVDLPLLVDADPRGSVFNSLVRKRR